MKGFLSLGLITILLLIIGCEEENQIPTCKIITPPINKREIQQGLTVPLKVEVRDPDGSISSIRFYVNNKPKDTIHLSPDLIQDEVIFQWRTSGEPLGRHHIKCEAFDNLGASSFDTLSVFLYKLVIDPQVPVAQFIASSVSVNEGDTVRFIDQSEWEPTSWKWRFEGGIPDTSVLQNPVILYDEPGTFSVSLTVTNALGTDNFTKTGYIEVKETNGPEAEFSVSALTLFEGDTVSFIDQSTDSPSDWFWDFGDGSTSTSQNPTHTYAKNGIYTVTLIATYNGTRSIEKKHDYITVLKSGSVTDIEGNKYKTVLIGNQWWMAENLSSTKYANGKSIPHVNDNNQWNQLNSYSKAYCWYGDEISNKTTYGALYTWAAATNGSVIESTQGVCPTGWHLPSNEEWYILERELERYQTNRTFPRGYGGGSKLKAPYDWRDDDDFKGTNAVGFTALPGGFRKSAGSFEDKREGAYWWSSTQNEVEQAHTRYLKVNYWEVLRDKRSKSAGLSVRCVKD